MLSLLQRVNNRKTEVKDCFFSRGVYGLIWKSRISGLSFYKASSGSSGPTVSSDSGSQSVVPGPAAFTSPGILLNKQALHPRPTESGTGVGWEIRDG